MTEKTTPGNEPVRAAEVIAAACLATDLGMGFPFEHGLHGTLMAMRLADVLDVDRETESQTYYASLLMYSGCTTDADIAARVFAGRRSESITPVQFGSTAEALRGFIRALPSPHDLPHRRAFEVARRLVPAARFRNAHFAALCEVAEMMAKRLGLPPELHKLFVHLTERWDGRGVLRRAKGDEIPLPVRIVHVARDAAYQRIVGGDDHAVEVIRRRAGHAFDPAVARRFVEGASEIMAVVEEPDSAWEAILAAEPRPWLTLEGEGVDEALAAIGDFADLVSPHLSGHSRGVAELAVAAARLCGFGPSDVTLMQRAGFVHDVGRVGIDSRIWQRPAALTVDEWERVRLHPYYTERVLLRSGFLASLADVACAHHERLDGTGYHRRVSATTLTRGARLLAAADVFHAMCESRPHRDRRSLEEAAGLLGEEARAGRQDSEMVAAVIEAAGQPAPPVERPAGLTEREAEVVGLLARGLQTKQVARRLGISIKTADRHIQNAYRKIGISTRAAVTLFAMEHGLVPGERSWTPGPKPPAPASRTDRTPRHPTWGELPIPRHSNRPYRPQHRYSTEEEAGAMDALHTERIDTLIIGGGQAGLSVGYHLARRGVPFVIVDTNRRVGDSWRNRWDSLRLFTPNRFNGLPGMPFPGPRWGIPTKDEFADYLESYAERFELPVRTGVEVDQLTRNGDHFVATAGDRRFEADNVVVAMSSWQRPRVPQFASELDPRIFQLHASDYRNPGQLQDGDALVVGAGNSGAEIALDLARTHKVWLSGPSTGHLPFRPESAVARVLMPFIGRVIFHRVLTTSTPIGRRVRPKMLAKGDPLIRVKPKDLAAAGVERVPRTTGVEDGLPQLEDGRRLDVSNVVWCSGFHPGFSWIDLPVFGLDEPKHDRGVVHSEPGLYFVGLKFLYSKSSEQIHGVGRDAARIADMIAARHEQAVSAQR